MQCSSEEPQAYAAVNKQDRAFAALSLQQLANAEPPVLCSAGQKRPGFGEGRHTLM